jgi:hypothetical protein
LPSGVPLVTAPSGPNLKMPGVRAARRGAFRHPCCVCEAAVGVIQGLGIRGDAWALTGMAELIEEAA